MSFIIQRDYPVPARCSEPNFPYLVSFPRTGSHALRMMMELYLEKPSLTLSFFDDQPTDFSCRHIHDYDLAYSPSNVIYLMRNPVDTIFSNMCYEEREINDTASLWMIAARYRSNLQKWLRDEQFTQNKTVVSYEDLMKDPIIILGRVLWHLRQPPIDKERAAIAVARSSKERVQEAAAYNPKAVKLGRPYELRRKLFHEQYTAEICRFFGDFPEVFPR